MSDQSRRRFLTLAGIGTAAGVAAVAVPSAGAEEATMPADAAGAMAVFVDDIRTGRLTLMVDGGEVVVTDRKLAAHIARAYKRTH